MQNEYLILTRIMVLKVVVSKRGEEYLQQNDGDEEEDVDDEDVFF